MFWRTLGFRVWAFFHPRRAAYLRGLADGIMRGIASEQRAQRLRALYEEVRM